MLRRVMTNPPPEYDYVCYIDEAGDPGLKKVKPRTPNGASEWFIIAGALVPKEYEDEIANWLYEMKSSLINSRLSELHFAKLNDQNKQICCSILSKKQVRLFAIISNKQNMEGYHNPLAELMTNNLPSDNWYYCWMTRVLLERVTEYTARHSHKKHGRVGRVKIELSERGGLRYPQMQAYFDFLNIKSNGGRKKLFLPWGKLDFRTLHRDLMYVYRHSESPGLQLADIAASAYFKAVDVLDTKKRDPNFAKLLHPVMAKEPDSKFISGFGVKLIPNLRTLRSFKVPQEQLEILYHFGYPHQWWQKW